MINYFYVLLFFIFTPISVYVLIKHYNNRLVVWGALAFLVAGMSGLQIGLEKMAIPYLVDSGVSAVWLRPIQIVSGILNIAINTFPYYLSLVFSLHYSRYQKAMLSFLLSVPVLMSFALSDVYPNSWLNFSFILAWGIPYLLGAATLFGRVLFREKFLPKYGQHATIAFIFIVPQVFLVLYQLEDRYIVHGNFLIYIPFLCLLSIVLGSVQYVHNSVLNIQHKTILTKMQVGASLMQHAFKNVIGKNRLNALNIRRSLEKKNYEEIDRHLQNLLSSNDHLLKLTSKLSYLTKNNIPAEIEPCDIGSVLDEVIHTFGDQTQISFVKRYSSMVVPIDRTFIAECLANVISNAMEAIEGGGCITVSLEKSTRKTVIMIADTGIGMEKEQLYNLFEPFFSTKSKTGNNFGLGMYHVKKIMDAHRGKVKVSSEKGKGTVVELVFL